MTDIFVYRGFLRDDGFPQLERVQWAPSQQGATGAVALPSRLGLPNTYWRFVGGESITAQLPVTPPVLDAFGNVITPGGLPPAVAVYTYPLQPRFLWVPYTTFLTGHEAYRQATDPIGIPPLDPGAPRPLYLDPPDTVIT